MKILIILASIIMTASAASALEYQRALMYQALEMADCAAYYTVCYKALERDRAAAPENILALDAGQRAMEYALMMSNKDVAEARLESTMGEMNETLESGIPGLTTLLDHHGDRCRLAVENPFQRLRYWLDTDDGT